MPTPEKSISELWDDYAKDAVPEGAPLTQYIETRRAFNAGAFAAFAIFESVGQEGISEEEGVAILEAVKAELIAFYQAVLDGTA